MRSYTHWVTNQHQSYHWRRIISHADRARITHIIIDPDTVRHHNVHHYHYHLSSYHHHTLSSLSLHYHHHIIIIESRAQQSYKSTVSLLSNHWSPSPARAHHPYARAIGPSYQSSTRSAARIDHHITLSSLSLSTIIIISLLSRALQTIIVADNDNDITAIIPIKTDGALSTIIALPRALAINESICLINWLTDVIDNTKLSR